MPTEAALNLVELLQRHRLLEPAQLAALADMQKQFPEPRAFAKELVARRWLTTYQANQLIVGNVKNLVLGPYALLEKLGEGGMGQVFKARQQRLGRIDAIKLIRKERLDKPDAIKRFYREIRAAAQLNHPNIVRAYDAGEVDGVHYFAMEYVDGTDLAAVVKQRGPLPIAEACDYIRQAAAGLQHAFERGLVHRDIKPHNLLVSGSVRACERESAQPGAPTPPRSHAPTIKLLDLGLARLEGGLADDKSSTMTHEGTVMGTPDYIAPEQARSSHEVDIRADIYSLGCTFYYLLTGRVPFPGRSLTEKLLKHQLEEPTAVELLRLDTPAEVAAIVRGMMAKKPAERFQTPAEVVAAIEMISGSLAGEASPSVSQTVPTEVDDALASTPPESRSETLPLVERLRQRRLATQKRLQKRFVFAGGIVIGVLIVGLALFMIIRSLDRREPSHPPEAVVKSTNSKPPTKKAEAKRPPSPEEQEREFQAKHAAEAEAAYPALEAKSKAAGVTFASFAKEVAAFKAKHGGTPAAIKAAEMLMKLPSPLDQLAPKKLPQDCIDYWDAIGQGPPKELVGVLGEHRWHIPAPFDAGPAVNPDGTLLAVGSANHILLLDARAGHVRRAFPGSGMLLQFSPDGKTLACLHWPSNDIKLYDVPAQELRVTLKGHTGQVWSLAFTPDSKTLVSGAEDGTIRLWDLSGAKQPRTIAATPFGFEQKWAVAISPGGKTVAAKGSPDAVKFWDISSGEERRTLAHPKVCSVAFSPKDNIVATGAFGGTVKIWDATTGNELQTFVGVPEVALLLRFSPDGGTLAVARSNAQMRSMPSEMRLWDTGTWKERAVLPHSDQITQLAFSRDSRTVFSSQWASHTVRLWDVATGKEVQPLTGHTGAVLGIAFSPVDQRLVSSGADGSLRLWDATASRQQWRSDASITPGKVVVAFAGDNQRVLVGTMNNGDGHLHVVEANTGKTLLKFPAVHEAGRYGLAFSPDGRNALTGGGDGSVYLWDADTGQRLREMQAQRRPTVGHDNRVDVVSFSPDNRTAVSLDSNTLRLWNLESGRELRSIPVAAQSPSSLAVSPDGRYLLGGFANASAHLIDLERGQVVQECAAGTNIVGLSFSPDSKQAGIALASGRIHLYDVATRAKLREWQLPGPVHAVAFANDGRHLATANGNGTVYILRIPPVANAPGSPIKALTAEEAKQQQEDEAKRLGVPVQIENSIGMKLNLIPAGRFLMGSPESEEGRQPNEGPQHEVTITRPFHIGVYEVTQAEYEKVTNKNPSNFNKDNGGGPDHPVEMVSWDDAVAFCKKLSELPSEKKAGRVYRLPTEAEWEYACRAGTQTAYSFGDPAGKLEKYGWFAENAKSKTYPVGQLLPNAWGLHDMLGNVSEWCLDTYRVFENKPVIDPQGPAIGGTRALRGGMCNDGAGQSRSAARLGNDALGIILGTRQFNVGFRVMCEIRPPQITNSIGMGLARIPAGKFLMGSPENEPGRQANEGPQHEVTITKPFHIGVYEVTQAEYEKVTAKNPSYLNKANGGGPDHPVEMVSWDDAVAFCKKLSELPEEKKAGRVYRLPSEAEWEYACRAGTRTAYYFGDDAGKLGEYGWVPANSQGKSHPVGLLQRNAWGLHDMVGNVKEWCADGYDADAYQTGARQDPQGPDTGKYKVLRGGDISSFTATFRSACRSPAESKQFVYKWGFRVVCEVRPSAKSAE